MKLRRLQDQVTPRRPSRASGVPQRSWRSKQSTPRRMSTRLDDGIEDDLLRPGTHGLPSGAVPKARVALTPRVLGGLTTEEIARAFLVAEPTVAQHIVRAKTSFHSLVNYDMIPRYGHRGRRARTR